MSSLTLFVLAACPAFALDPGERAFARCYACHSVDPEETDLPGPNLAGVVGRRAAALPDFRYSPAMRAVGARGLTWDVATLERYIADPQAVVPGTDMGLAGLSDQAERQAVIDYLRRH